METAMDSIDFAALCCERDSPFRLGTNLTFAGATWGESGMTVDSEDDGDGALSEDEPADRSASQQKFAHAPLKIS